MSSSPWTRAALDAAGEIAAAAEHASAEGAALHELGRLLVSLGEAAGHVDQLRLEGAVGRAGRKHFREHMVGAGASAAVLLRRGYRERGLPLPELQELTAAVAGRRVISAREDEETQVRAAHAAARVGAAISALGHVLASITLDEQSLPELDDAVESVLAEAIAAVAFAPGGESEESG